MQLASKTVFDLWQTLSKVSVNAEPFANHYVQAGVIQILIGFLDDSYQSYSNLQADASWALCNLIIALPQSIECALKHGILDSTIKVLEYGQGAFLEQVLLSYNLSVNTTAIKTVWIIVNIIGNSASAKEEYLRKGLAKKIAQRLLSNEDNFEITKTGLGLLSSLIQDKPYPLLEQVETIQCRSSIINYTVHRLKTACPFYQDFYLCRTEGFWRMSCFVSLIFTALATLNLCQH